MITIHKDSDLRIMALTKVKIGYTTANFHDTVLIQTALIAVSNCNAAGVQTCRTLKLRKGITAIITMIITQ